MQFRGRQGGGPEKQGLGADVTAPQAFADERFHAALDIPAELCGRIATRAEGDFRLVRNMMLLLEKAAKAAENFTVDESMLDTVLSARPWRRK